MNPEDLKTKTPYTVRPYNGVFIFRHMNDNGTAQLIRVCDERFYINADPATISTDPHEIPADNSSIFNLCAEAVQKFKLDPARVMRAAQDIAFTAGMMGNATRDEFGNAISPTPAVKWVRGSKGGFYTVRRGSCTCHDSRVDGNKCKHRIASWLHDEQIIRSSAWAQRQPAEKIRAQYYAPNVTEYAEVIA